MKEIMNEWRVYRNKIIKEGTGDTMARIAYTAYSQQLGEIEAPEILEGVAKVADVNLVDAKKIVGNFVQVLTEIVGNTIQKTPLFKSSAIKILKNLITSPFGRRVFDVLKLGVRVAPFISIALDIKTIAEQINILLKEMEKTKTYMESEHYFQIKALEDIRETEGSIRGFGQHNVLMNMTWDSYSRLKRQFDLASKINPNIAQFFPSVVKLLNDYVESKTRKEGEPLNMAEQF